VDAVGLTTFWRDRRVLLTGHTGFKGAWLAFVLKDLGAEVHGIALNPLTEPSLYDVLGLARRLDGDHRIDVIDADAMATAVKDTAPECVIHLAAQSLVRQSYQSPAQTFEVNLMGTVNVLEAVRAAPSVRAAIVVTTDKCYENVGWEYPYRETDQMGGHDPYSASKACAEIAAAAYRRSFFPSAEGAARIASVRAGNVIGGGDWAADRLIPDCARAFAAGESVILRYPHATRPWQHVLDPLAGYLALGERLLGEAGEAFADAWNFGPDAAHDGTVFDVATRAAAAWGGDASVEKAADAPEFEEAVTLRLDSSRARHRLGWAGNWGLGEAVTRTIDWYRAFHAGSDMVEVTQQQVRAFRDATA